MKTIHLDFGVAYTRAADGEERVITGMATTPTVDRMGDIVDPLGVKVPRDVPLFLYHDSTLTVGRARFGRASPAGIPFEARIPRVVEDGALRTRVDEAWQLVKYGLITAVSIGFRVLEDAIEPLKGGGVKFLKSELLELSLVPVPANAQAVITAIKSIQPHDRKLVERAGRSPGAPGLEAAAARRGAVQLIRRTYGT